MASAPVARLVSPFRLPLVCGPRYRASNLPPYIRWQTAQSATFLPTSQPTFRATSPLTFGRPFVVTNHYYH
ncbi:uncharacterized protein K460DRAFT_367812 [Cucurbitaria berberidis CBS 394.84]|uniref:Uncharacterized protein n=1 Tax=Cucurbitaria berberidis CBS 394.84 TaxID=1168544 RepID=A0A9P4GC20_9PLEO|nr:uncharacterized protein K460DRAFT_367812 [Cucurbitaria berberidis CBS 394.84]KAF1842867.1 hypothetical protein K460DRAFT_367812 [Cucurbitaria berberidis CBS 394.84]